MQVTARGPTRYKSQWLVVITHTMGQSQIMWRKYFDDEEDAAVYIKNVNMEDWKARHGSR